MLSHRENLACGTLAVDTNHPSLILFHAPHGYTSGSYLLRADAGTICQVSAVVTPLTVPLGRFHSFFSDTEPYWQIICSGHDMVINQPNLEHPETYEVYQNGSLKCSFNKEQGTWEVIDD